MRWSAIFIVMFTPTTSTTDPDDQVAVHSNSTFGKMRGDCKRMFAISSRRYMLLFTVTLVLFMVKLYLTSHRKSNSIDPILAIDSTDACKGRGHPTRLDFKVEQEVRLKRYHDVCMRTQHNVDFKTRLINDKEHKLTFCLTHKAGSTFILRFFRFFTDQQNMYINNMKSPFDLTRTDAHYMNMPRSCILDPGKDYWSIMANSTRITFTRDPYTRLYATYVDKFLIPEFTDRFKEDILELKSSQAKNDCEKVMGLTFPEFVEMILSGVDDSHWNPVHQKCNPCKFLPDVIGKMETFTEDITHVLALFKAQHVLKDYDHFKDEVAILVGYHFDFHKKTPFLQKCISYIDLADRIWTSFQWNGYIPSEEAFPREDMLRILYQSLDQAKEYLVSEVISRQKVMKTEIAPRKHRMMLQAYKSLSKTNLKRLAEYYSLDFQLYGYEQYPCEIFTDD